MLDIIRNILMIGGILNLSCVNHFKMAVNENNYFASINNYYYDARNNYHIKVTSGMVGILTRFTRHTNGALTCCTTEHTLLIQSLRGRPCCLWGGQTMAAVT